MLGFLLSPMINVQATDRIITNITQIYNDYTHFKVELLYSCLLIVCLFVWMIYIYIIISSDSRRLGNTTASARLNNVNPRTARDWINPDTIPAGLLTGQHRGGNRTGPKPIVSEFLLAQFLGCFKQARISGEETTGDNLKRLIKQVTLHTYIHTYIRTIHPHPHYCDALLSCIS